MNVQKNGMRPGPYTGQLMLKIVAKLGGVNSVLQSCDPRANAIRDCFQNPPHALVPHLDVPTIILGVDVSHPDPSERDTGGMEGAPSVAGASSAGRTGGSGGGGGAVRSGAAVVASMDREFSRYSCVMASQEGELVGQLADMVERLLQAWKRANGLWPQRIIVYRDGISDGELSRVLEPVRVRSAALVDGCVGERKGRHRSRAEDGAGRGGTSVDELDA